MTVEEDFSPVRSRRECLCKMNYEDTAYPKRMHDHWLQ